VEVVTTADRDDEVALAVDVGGTKLEVGLVGLDGVARWRSRIPTPQEADGEALFSALTELVADAPSANVVVCGIGVGGPQRARGEYVSPLSIPAWTEFPLRARLEEVTGLGTYLDNDAKALALAEGWRGVAVGAANYLAMVVSTGVGAGLVVDGRMLDGDDSNAGHIGHVIVVPDGRRCLCGARGCLEAEVSGNAIAATTGRPAAEASPAVIERAGRLVGRAVASVVNLLDLRLAAVAGSVALGFGRPFFAAAQRELDASCRLGYSKGARITPAGLGARAPLIGAAAVGWRGLLGEACLGIATAGTAR
jgi:glucokinase